MGGILGLGSGFEVPEREVGGERCGRGENLECLGWKEVDLKKENWRNEGILGGDLGEIWENIFRSFSVDFAVSV